MVGNRKEKEEKTQESLGRMPGFCNTQSKKPKYKFLYLSRKIRSLKVEGSKEIWISYG